MRDGFRQEGKVPVRSEILTIQRMVEGILLALFLRTLVAIGSITR